MLKGGVEFPSQGYLRVGFGRLTPTVSPGAFLHHRLLDASQTHSKGRRREASVISRRGFGEISSLLPRVYDVTGLILSTELQQKVQEHARLCQAAT